MLHLTVASDTAWAALAANDLGAVLVDHAHCELKAASNALSMAARQPDDPIVVRTLTDLAREEIDHFQRVHAILDARGIPLGSPPADPYVAALRRAQGSLGPSPIARATAAAVDRLLTCSLIEARSCERFTLLARKLQGRDGELAALYEELRTSEARHYRTFIDLAIHSAGGDADAVVSRLRELAAVEGTIVTTLAEESQRTSIHG